MMRIAGSWTQLKTTKRLRRALLTRKVMNPVTLGHDMHSRGFQGGLRDDEGLFRSIADTIPAMIWMSDPDMRCTFFNRAKLKFIGRSLDNVLGAGWTNGVHPEDLERCGDISFKASELKEPFGMEFRFRRYDGEHRWIASSGVPRFNAEGSFVGYVGSAIDITDRKQAKQFLFKLSQGLFGFITRLTN